jgi:N-acetylglutamate synthase-like GNAT family acetyltransferase
MKDYIGTPRTLEMRTALTLSHMAEFFETCDFGGIEKAELSKTIWSERVGCPFSLPAMRSR